ncbi:hypothetical protein N9K49_00530 [Flavobacteriaceae bacterium]|uniref:hypothetical protein n=1 Tax=Patiriisocius marinus TaxID=1397112 RepID=UPI00231DC431|nr:hypothetical protein [Patiriisocius marinus]MDA9056318.1 hypothetical protein [Flavobacteriaceae bacterium]
MKLNIIFTFLISFTLASCNSSTQEQFTIQIEPFSISEAPGIQSYALGKTSDGKWLVLGGRIDGLHKIRPFEAFLKKENNTSVFVIDPVASKTWLTDLSILPAAIFEQLQSTNQEFQQRGNTLYVIGGYGYSESKRDHITYPNLTAIDLDGLANAIINKANISTYFRQITDDKLAVTGGQLGLLNDIFYLCGGQYFEGRYNPMGPNHGPGFTQKYTNEIRTFKIADDGNNLSINNYSANQDIQNLHRRDYNMVPQIFPDNSKGFTMFSGVFQYDANIPWLNTVDVIESGYKVNNEFNQLLSQYHSAKVPIYNSETKEMMTVFFGGLSQYQFGENGKLIKDDEVPFVKTISMVTRNLDGSMIEKDLGIKMPTFLGSGAEFIPVSDETIYLENDIVNLNTLKQEKTLIGYIYGGIESSAENIFFRNNGTQSIASNQAFKVYITLKQE